jgi:hypothetical protein
VLAAPVKGHTTPRLFTPPLRELTPETSLGFECCDFLEGVLGWELRPYQRWLYIHALELLEDGSFRFDTIVVLIARQNGKTRWLLGLVLWRLFVDMAHLVISTAQDLDKAEELLDEGHGYIDDDPELRGELVKYLQTNGKRKITLTGKRRWKAQTATRKGGRSLSADMAILDELREHQSWAAWSAIVPTTTAVARSQVVAVSNAGDATSIVLRSVRDAAKRKIELSDTAATKVGLFEYSVPEGVSHRDETYWPYANPSIGFGITVEKLRGFLDTGMPEAEFRTEYLCDWVDVIEPGAFPEGAWEACSDPESRRDPERPIYYALEVSADRGWSHISIVGERSDGLLHVELVASRAGTDWVADWFRARLGRKIELVVQARGAPASSLIADLRVLRDHDEDGRVLVDEDGEELALTVTEWGGSDLTAGSGKFYDAVMNRRIRHRGQPRLDAAARLVKTKPSGDAYFFERRHKAGDPSPILSGVAGVWRALQPREDEATSAYDEMDEDVGIFA